MRGWYEITSQEDRRFVKSGKDFICPFRGPLNFNFTEWVWKQAERLKCEIPRDVRLKVFWHGEEEGCGK